MKNLPKYALAQHIARIRDALNASLSPLKRALAAPNVHTLFSLSTSI